MNIKKIALAFFIASSLITIAPVAMAEEHAEAPANSEVATVIGHIEKGLEQVQKSDFSAATLHLKAARFASEQLAVQSDAVKKGYASINQGMIQGKYGDVAKASAELNKALDFYKSIK